MGDNSGKVVFTFGVLMFGGNFWQKVIHTPIQNDQHAYWLNKLKKKMESAQKKIAPEFRAFVKELGEKAGQKDPTGKVIASGGMLPQADNDKREEYDAMLDAFMEKTFETDLDKLPLAYFSHIQKTPMDFDAIEQVAKFDPEQLANQGTERAAQGPHLGVVSQ